MLAWGIKSYSVIVPSLGLDTYKKSPFINMSYRYALIVMKYGSTMSPFSISIFMTDDSGGKVAYI